MKRGFIALFSGNTAGKLLGIFRELLLAALFGTSMPVSALRVATTGTLVPVNFVTADALSVGFLPNHASLLQSDPREAVVFYRVVEKIVLVLSAIVAMVLIVLQQTWVTIIAPGLSSGALGLAGEMLAIMALAIPFYVHSNLASFLEMSHGKYVLASARPAVQSVGLVVGTTAAFSFGQPLWLAAGFTGSYIAMSAWAFYRIHRGGYALIEGPTASSAERRKAARVFWQTLRPIIWLPVITQGVWVCERAIVSLVDGSAVAALDYARLITDTAYVLISAPLGLVMLSVFATLSVHEARERLAQLTRLLLLVGVPLSCFLVVGSRLIVTVVYARGAFDEDSVTTTTHILAGLSVAVWAQTVAYTQIKAMNAQRRNAAAAVVTVVSAVVWVGMQFALTRTLGVAGIGLGASAGAIAQVTASSIATGQLLVVIRRLVVLLPIIATSAALMTWPLQSEWVATGVVVVVAILWTLIVPSLRRESLALLTRFGLGPFG